MPARPQNVDVVLYFHLRLIPFLLLLLDRRRSLESGLCENGARVANVVGNEGQKHRAYVKDIDKPFVIGDCVVKWTASSGGKLDNSKNDAPLVPFG